MRPMIIAQISDTHVRAPGDLMQGRVDAADSLRRCVTRLNAMAPRPDAVLATGDLANDGRSEEYTHLREILAPLEIPLYPIPGNHDTREGVAEAFPDHDYLPRDGGFQQYVIDDYPLRLIALDTVIPGEVGGELCAERLAWLEARLDEARSRPTVVFMHHPPFETGMASMDRISCAGAEALGAVIERHPQVERILCGHVHRPIEVRWHGTVASICPSTAFSMTLNLQPEARNSWTDEPPGFQIHLWRPGTGLVSHLVYVHDFGGPYPFGGG